MADEVYGDAQVDSQRIRLHVQSGCEGTLGMSLVEKRIVSLAIWVVVCFCSRASGQAIELDADGRLDSSQDDSLSRPRIQVDRRLFLGFDYVQLDEAELRKTLLDVDFHRCGPLSLEALCTGEWFSNARGGRSTKDATRYLSNLDLTLALHLDEIGWSDMGTIVVYGQQHSGSGISRDFVGDVQMLSNLALDQARSESPLL